MVSVIIAGHYRLELCKKRPGARSETKSTLMVLSHTASLLDKGFSSHHLPIGVVTNIIHIIQPWCVISVYPCQWLLGLLISSSEMWVWRKVLKTRKRLVCSIKYEVCWSKFCVKKYYCLCVCVCVCACVCMCVCVCVAKYFNCAVQMLWLVSNDLYAE